MAAANVKACLGASSYPGRIHSDLVDAGARRDEQRLTVGLAETNIGRLLGRADRAEVLAFRRDHPDPARASLVEIALGVDPHAVGDAALGAAAHVDEELAVGERPVALHVVAVDVVVAAAV